MSILTGERVKQEARPSKTLRQWLTTTLLMRTRTTTKTVKTMTTTEAGATTTGTTTAALSATQAVMRQEKNRLVAAAKGLAMLLTGGMSLGMRRLVTDFYLHDQRNIDIALREQRSFGLTGVAELADFSEEDFAEAASDGNFE